MGHATVDAKLLTLLYAVITGKALGTAAKINPTNPVSLRRDAVDSPEIFPFQDRQSS